VTSLFSFPQTDWEKRIVAGKPPVDLHKYDRKLNKNRVDLGMRVFGNLRLADVPEQPYLAEACPAWFSDIARLLLGSVGTDGKSRIQNTLISVAKKNSKTSYAGLLLLTQMLLSPRPRATFLLVGPTQSISDLAYSQIVGAITADDFLMSRLHVRDHLKRIEDRKSGCILTVKTFNMEVATGVKPAGVLLDEVHLLHRDEHRRVVGQLRGGMASIPEASMMLVTTHADIPPSGFWHDELKKARAVRDAETDLKGYLPIIYEPPASISADDKKILTPAAWRFGNPNLGVSVDEEWLKQSFEDARLAGETETNRWLSQHANLEIKRHRLSDRAWSATHFWDDAADIRTFSDLDDLLDQSEWVAGGIDGGGLDDLLSVCFIGKLLDGRWAAFQKSYIQHGALERQPQNKTLYREFSDAGDLEICPPGEDLERVVDLLMYVAQNSDFVGLGSDPAGIMSEIATSLVAAGFDGERIIQVPQGFRIQPALISVGRRLAEKRLVHANQPLFGWSMANAVLNDRGFLSKADAGSVTRGSSSNSGAAKIDPVIALLCAAMIALEAEQTYAPSARGDAALGDINGWSDPSSYLAVKDGFAPFAVVSAHAGSGGTVVFKGGA